MFWVIDKKFYKWFQGWAKANDLKVINKIEENNKLRVMVIKA
jgi:hypothetical protein